MKLVAYALKCFGRIYFSLLYEILRAVTKVDEKKILFVSDVRGTLEGSLKYVWDYMDDPAYTKKTYLKSDRRDWNGVRGFNAMIYDLATSGRVLLEDYFRYISYIRPREGQEVCQLWHACGAYKKFGYSRASGGEGIKIHKGYKKYAKAITSAEAIRKDYAEAFGISMEKVKAVGVPRTDVFFDDAVKEEKVRGLYVKYPLLKGKKVILFAPTYRGLRAEDAGYDLERLDYEKLYETFHEEYVFAFKWHPAFYNNLRRKDVFSPYIAGHPDFFLDLSAEREINDLLLLADVMVTDYSSVIFEYALLDRPIIYFAYDLEDYAGSRGLYYDFQEYVYGAVVRDCDGLIDAIREGDMMPARRGSFTERFMGACDGHSTERTCEWIFHTKAERQ